MFEISVEAYAENCIHTITVHKNHNKTVLWSKMFDIQDKLGVKRCAIRNFSGQGRFRETRALR